MLEDNRVLPTAIPTREDAARARMGLRNIRLRIAAASLIITPALI